MGSELEGAVDSCVCMSLTTWLYCVINVLSADWMLALDGAGGETFTVTGPEVVVTPVSVRVTPAIAPVTVFDADHWVAPPLTLYSAFWPSRARPVCCA